MKIRTLRQLDSQGFALRNLELVCFISNFYGLEVRENLFAHSPMKTNGLGWLPEIIPLLRKKFHGPTTSRTLSMIAKVKNVDF